MRRRVLVEGGALTMEGATSWYIVRWEGTRGWKVVEEVEWERKLDAEDVEEGMEEAMVVVGVEESLGSWRRPAAQQFVPPERKVMRIDFCLEIVWRVRMR